jgi:hypothetical protein
MNDMSIAKSILPGNVSALPDRWIERIFERMEGLYGTQFQAKWQDCNLPRVKALWAEKLAGFATMPDCIRSALEALDERPFPPNLPEFLSLCRDAAKRQGNGAPMLPHHPTPEEQARADEAAELAVKAVRANGSDDLAWAKAPRSQIACRFVFEAAQRDARMAAIRDQLIADGVASKTGELLYQVKL